MNANDDGPSRAVPERLLAETGTDFERRLLQASRVAEDPDATLRRRVIERVLADETPARVVRAQRTRLGLGIAAFGLAAALALALNSTWRSSSRADQLPLSAEPMAPRRSAPVPLQKTKEQRMACAKVMVASGSDARIDDFEDRNANLLPLEQRQGTWRISTDGTGILSEPPINHIPATRESPEFWVGTWHPEPIPRGRAQSHYALHTRGGKFSDWGIVASAAFVVEPGACYDASSYAGLAFWAKGTSRLAVSASMIDVLPSWEGGLCESDCYKRHVRQIELGSDWQHYSISWSELDQYAIASAIAFDPRRLRSIDFLVIAGSTPFELWLDDVSFLRGGPDQGTSGAAPREPPR